MAQNGNRIRAVVYFLLLVLSAPYAIKVVHRHPVNPLAECLPGGLNGAEGTDHTRTCVICSFEYVNVLPDEPLNLQVYPRSKNQLIIPPIPADHSDPVLFVSPRAPPTVG